MKGTGKREIEDEEKRRKRRRWRNGCGGDGGGVKDCPGTRGKWRARWSRTCAKNANRWQHDGSSKTNSLSVKCFRCEERRDDLGADAQGEIAAGETSPQQEHAPAMNLKQSKSNVSSIVKATFYQL
jgi:hypothetical protein